MRLLTLQGLAALAVLVTGESPRPTADQPRVTIDVAVNEGTSMSVAASPDGRTLAIDLQGSIWTLPVSGGAARRITDEYNDARQPTWSADGRTIAFQGYRDGGYDIWAIDTDGTNLRKLTWGPYDDREPAWSRDGSRVAFSSDRGGNYDLWVLDLTSGELQQVTRDAGDDYMPSWSPDGTELAFIGTRNGSLGVHAIALSSGTERRLAAPSGRADAPSWGPGGEFVYHASGVGSSRLEHNGKSLTGDENAFAFRAGWLSAREIVYTADGRLRRRDLGGGAARQIEFSASLTVTPARYAKRRRDADSRAPRNAVGVVGPAISPDGRQVAFVALGDLYVMPVGGAPRNITNDGFLDAEPAWSPDGRYLAWSSDRGGALLDVWVRDMTTGAERRLTQLPTSEMGAAWSPDGTRIAFLDVDGIWRRANVSVVDVSTGKVTQIHAPLFGPGNPTWSADGRHVAVAALTPYSARFREGTNQILAIPSSGGQARLHTPVPHLSIDSRVGAGPAWSPDGSRMAVIYEGLLAVVPVARDGTPTGPPRRLTNEMAHAPSWTRDSRSILYQSNDKLRLLDVETGDARDVPLTLRYTPAIPTGRVVVHAGSLVDGASQTVRRDVDIVIEGNRIRRVVPHSEANKTGARFVDASALTAMPGLIEYHTHLQKDLGEASGRAYLAFGVTTVRSPGSTPYEAAEDREAIEAGTRPGPRLFTTGYLMEWNRVYYKMAVAVSSNAHLELELARARALRHDLIKSYVRMPDLQQRRIVQFAHAMGVPASSHEIFPSSLSGIDGTEHTTGTSRRGYSPKAATLQRSYGDVAQLFATSGMPLTPTLALGGGGMRRLVEKDSSLRRDARFALYPPWLSAQVTGVGGGGGGGTPPGAVDPNAGGQMVIGLMRAGTKIVAGTDTPNAATLHGELYSYVLAGMTPYEALRTATVNSAEMLGIDAGVIAPGKLADLAIVDGNPLTDITATTRVRLVVANGRVFSAAELLSATRP
jgi:Tol biopolymer transport system component